METANNTGVPADVSPDYSEHFNLANTFLERIATALENIDKHLDTAQNDTNNLASKITHIDNHLDTAQNHTNNLASKITHIDNHLDTDQRDNLASRVANIDNNTSSVLYSSAFLLRDVSGTFLIGERIVFSNSAHARVLFFDDVTPYIYVSEITVGRDFVNGRLTTSWRTITSGLTFIGEDSGATGTIVIEDVPTNVAKGATNEQIGRAMMLANLKATDNLETVRYEIMNPTPL